MNFQNYKQVEEYLSHQQVFIKKEIVNANFKTITLPNRVYQINKVDVDRINEDTIAITLYFEHEVTTIYEYMTDNEFFKWINLQFIPIKCLVEYYSKKQ